MARRGENIYKRKDHRWEGRYRNGFKPDGSVKYSSVYGKSYSEVKVLLTEKKKAISDNRNYAECDLTVKELFSLWMNDISTGRKESTLSGYSMKIEKHIIPAIGGYRYTRLDSSILNDFVADKLSQGLSAKYVYDIAVLIRSVCKFARKRFHCIDRSEFMEMPRKDRKVRPMLSRSEQEQLNNYLLSRSDRKNLGILICSATGMRIGEVCALKASDIDLDKGTILIGQTVQRITDKHGNSRTKIIVTLPKSVLSVREIPIPAAIIEPVRSVLTQRDCYLLTGTDKPLEPRTLQYRLKALLKKINLRNINFHSLRHSFATGCIENGTDVKTISEILGHSSVKITLDRYVHSSFKRKQECMDLFSKRFVS